MNLITKILVPIDFSPPSAEAVSYAADLARRYGAEITLLHVYQPIAYAIPDGFILHTQAELSRLFAEFDKQLAAARAVALAGGAERVSTKLLQGITASEILDFAKAGGHDLIVMGTHGRTVVDRWMLGSVAEKIVRKATCPVLTIHPRNES